MQIWDGLSEARDVGSIRAPTGKDYAKIIHELQRTQEEVNSISPIRIQFSAEAIQATLEDGASLSVLDGTNVDLTVRVFDDTTEEFVRGGLKLPDNLSSSDDVTFTAIVMAKTAAASKNVQHRFGHVALKDSESLDSAYTDVDSGDKVIDATQGDISIHTWTESVSNLGWEAEDFILFRYSRIAPSADNLSGDMYLVYLTIEF